MNPKQVEAFESVVWFDYIWFCAGVDNRLVDDEASWVQYRSLLDINAMLFGLVSVLGSFLRAFSDGKSTLYNGLIWVGFALSIAAVVRTGDGVTLGLVSAVSVVFGMLMTLRLPTSNRTRGG